MLNHFVLIYYRKNKNAGKQVNKAEVSKKYKSGVLVCLILVMTLDCLFVCLPS